MNPFALAVFVIAKNVLGGKSELKMKTLQAWIDENGDRDRYGMGYTGNRLSKGPSSGYVEVTKTGKPGQIEVRASVYLDPRQGAAMSKSWNVAKLDSALEKYFGKDKRVRVRI